MHINECLVNTDNDGWRSILKNLTINTVMELQVCRFTGTVFYKYDEMRANVKTQKRFNFQLRM